MTSDARGCVRAGGCAGVEEAVVVGLRFLNCCMGGVSWLAYRRVLARWLGGGGRAVARPALARVL